MWTRLIRFAKGDGDYRRKILFWTTLVSLIWGAIDFGEPLEDRLRIARNALHKHPASGDVVVVGIDDRTTDALSWPMPRRYHAELIDRLRLAGARNVMFDVSFANETNKEEDSLLENSLIHNRGHNILPVYWAGSRVDQGIGSIPAERFARHARLASAVVMKNPFNEVWQATYYYDILGKRVPSYPIALSGRTMPKGEPGFMIDYSIDLFSIPTYSALDILRGKIRPNVRGKDVFIGLSSARYGDIHYIPGLGDTPGVYILALSTETLKQGIPVDWGWLPSFAVALLAVIAYLFSRRRLIGNAVLAAGLLIFAVAPIFLEMRMIHNHITAGLLLMISTGIVNGWARAKQRAALVNLVSGLPNLAALRLMPSRRGYTLVAAQIHNYAQIVSTLPPEGEPLLIAQIESRFRLGVGGAALHQGDEGVFAWLAAGQPGPDLSDQLEGLHALFTSPVAVDGRRFDLSITFGLDGEGDRTMANRVGSAIVVAREALEEGNKWKVYDPARLADTEWRLSLLGRLDTAIDNGEIWIAFQPKLDLRTRRIVGAEALARWSHPEKGEIPPQDFILIAEQHNRIDRLTLHVLDQALRATALIRAHDIEFDVAVNLSPRMLEKTDLATVVMERLTRADLTPDCLTLEVTESAAMGGGGKSLRVLERLGSLGIAISLDDYGTGYSTLEYLRDIPATEIKIDKRFVAAMDRNNSDRLMVHSTIQLAHSLGRQVVAEGVERPEVLESLASMRCDRAQGYLIGKPMRFAALARALLADRKEKAA